MNKTVKNHICFNNWKWWKSIYKTLALRVILGNGIFWELTEDIKGQEKETSTCLRPSNCFVFGSPFPFRKILSPTLDINESSTVRIDIERFVTESEGNDIVNDELVSEQ